MYVQHKLQNEGQTFLSTSGSEVIKLPQSGLLSGVDIYVYGANGSDGGKPDIWLHDRITKIELIVNGSQIVKSLSGKQVIADMLYKRTQPNSHDSKNMIGGSYIESFYLNLGRFYHDMEYLLDLGKVQDPQLRFTYNFTLTSEGGWTNGVAMSAAPAFHIIPHIVRDHTGIVAGYIKTSEVGRFTGAASKKENVRLPIGPLYANIYVQSWYKAAGLGYQLDKLELNLNNDQLIPVRVGVDQLADMMARQYGKFQLTQYSQLKGGQAYPFPLEHGNVINIANGLEDAHASGFWDIWGNNSSPGFKKDSDGVTPVTSSYNCMHTSYGVFPFSVTALPNFDLMDDRTWIDSRALGDLWTRVELNASGNSSSTVIVLADEVVRQ